MRQSSFQKQGCSKGDVGCYLCKMKGMDCEQLLNTALFHKYSEKAGYKMYYHITCLLKRIPNKFTCRFKDQEFMDNQEEMLKRYYSRRDSTVKIQGLTDYYQYHQMAPRCHLLKLDMMVQKHRHLHLKLYYKQVKRQLNMSIEKSTISNCTSSNSQSSTVTTAKCSCVLCGLTNLQCPHICDDTLVNTQSKALQDVIQQMIGSSLQNQNYLQQGFMFKKPTNNSRAFEIYVSACEKIDAYHKIQKTKMLDRDNLQYNNTFRNSVAQSRLSSNNKSSRNNQPELKRMSPIQVNHSKGQAFKKLIQQKLKFNYFSAYSPEKIHTSKHEKGKKSSIYQSSTGNVVRITSRKPSLNDVRIGRPTLELLKTRRLRGKSDQSTGRSGSDGSLSKIRKLHPLSMYTKRRNTLSLQQLRKAQLPSMLSGENAFVSRLHSNKNSQLKRDPSKGSVISHPLPSTKTLKLNTKIIYEKLKFC